MLHPTRHRLNDLPKCSQRNLARRRLLGWVSGTGLLLGLAGLPWASAALAAQPTLRPLVGASQPLRLKDIIINAPIILPQPAPARQRVRVQFVARGQEWAAVYLDDRLLYRPGNFNRREEFWLTEGAYRLRITGVNRFEVWASGYLDVGRDDASILIVTFSKAGGVSVAGDPYAWLPDSP